MQEGESPAEDPEQSIKEFEALSDEHAAIVDAIGRANMQSKAVNGDSMWELLHQRETLRRKRNVHEMAINAASAKGDAYRYMRTELTFVRHINVANHREAVKDLDQALRRLDAIIQESNWSIKVDV